MGWKFVCCPVKKRLCWQRAAPPFKTSGETVFCFEPKGCLVGNKKRTAQRSSSDCYINCKPMKIGEAASP
ncbi:hypothetical protein CLOSTMETH_01585 [[Clostridium] methylpentosum DSM 5476]|uniref:Uncharacterized protein n=1 Tax=[Clostridium] methylpentosum DSM 5476 TaxID=537013 RepID=C0ECL4_9FIRM|nr:hypothetical protein CLOSTMETH_01585 [[Clostridium] methylpentosum DSM 5476]